MLARLFRPFTYWVDLYREIRIFTIFRRTANENAEMLEEKHKLRVDWLGRIYGVINIPEEVETAAPQVQEAYVLQAITTYGKVMMQIGLADAMYPEIEKIPGSPAYLVVLWPEYRALALWPIIGNLIRTTAVLFGLYFLGSLISHNTTYFFQFIDWMKSIL